MKELWKTYIVILTFTRYLVMKTHSCLFEKFAYFFNCSLEIQNSFLYIQKPLNMNSRNQGFFYLIPHLSFSCFTSSSNLRVVGKCIKQLMRKPMIHTQTSRSCKTQLTKTNKHTNASSCRNDFMLNMVSLSLVLLGLL